jgi:hypothetical protein
MRTEYYMGFVI